MENRLKTSELEVEIATREKAKMEVVLQQLLVERNLMRLQVRRLQGIYQKHATKVSNIFAYVSLCALDDALPNANISQKFQRTF